MCKGKKVLVIGSGADLVGRGLGRLIDSGRWDVVVRVNQPFGAPSDVGSKMDVLVTRWRSWVPQFFKGPVRFEKLIVLNERVGMSSNEINVASVEVGAERVSAGLCACIWALNRGAKSVSVIGFGYHPATGWAPQKRYPDGTLDPNSHYNWAAENRWLEKNVTLI